MTDDPMPCAKCGKRHYAYDGKSIGCAGHVDLEDGSIRPCTQRPIRGGTVCGTHGGRSPQVKAAAQRNLAEAESRKHLQEGLALAYGGRVPDVDPAEAMLQAVSWKYAEVVALRAQVATVGEADLVWGVTREKSGGDDEGTTWEAKPNIWLSLLHEAERDLVTFAAKARAAGVDERRVKLAEEQGVLVHQVMDRVLEGVLRMLLESGLGEGFVEVFRAAVREVAPRELRALASGGEGE